MSIPLAHGLRLLRGRQSIVDAAHAARVQTATWIGWEAGHRFPDTAARTALAQAYPAVYASPLGRGGRRVSGPAPSLLPTAEDILREAATYAGERLHQLLSQCPEAQRAAIRDDDRLHPVHSYLDQAAPAVPTTAQLTRLAMHLDMPQELLGVELYGYVYDDTAPGRARHLRLQARCPSERLLARPGPWQHFDWGPDELLTWEAGHLTGTSPTLGDIKAALGLTLENDEAVSEPEPDEPTPTQSAEATPTGEDTRIEGPRHADEAPSARPAPGEPDLRRPVSAHTIRVWAAHQPEYARASFVGETLLGNPPRGRLPGEVIDAYENAHPDHVYNVNAPKYASGADQPLDGLSFTSDAPPPSPGQTTDRAGEASKSAGGADTFDLEEMTEGSRAGPYLSQLSPEARETCRELVRPLLLLGLTHPDRFGYSQDGRGLRIFGADERMLLNVTYRHPGALNAELHNPASDPRAPQTHTFLIKTQQHAEQLARLVLELSS